jgi:high-affinity Fe2+/Pb2+ permease
MSYTFPIRLHWLGAFGGSLKMTVSLLGLGLLLQETPTASGNASMVRIIAGVLALILVVIVIVRRKRAVKKEEDEF